MALDLETISVFAKSYADDVRQILPVEKALLYGSYANGNATEESDIDICFFLKSFGGNDKHDIIVKLLGLVYKYNLYIEPNVFEVSDLYTDNPFVKEVIRSGIEI
jgi:predicted nucleotidyltransferase